MKIEVKCTDSGKVLEVLWSGHDNVLNGKRAMKGES